MAVNTAEETLQLVLSDDGRVAAVFEEHCAGRMNEVMAPAVTRMLKLDGRSGAWDPDPSEAGSLGPGGRVQGPADRPFPVRLTGVACVCGPGSFTGLRLGLAFATGFSLARGLPMAGIDYLPLLAVSALADSRDTRGFDEIHVLTHSRTARVYHQGFARTDGDALAPLGPPRDLSTAEAREALAGRAALARVVALGTGLRRNQDAFADIPGVTLLPMENPTPEALARASQAATFDGPPVDALYLRGSDAEENLAMIAKGRGLTEEEALERMEKALKS
nr:tRNA (adenosine(37)-N6)-threonylcarbamoyltransferase complex dimerization subunit type 1 TsaB [Fundidesulfovibrio terrae]